MRWMNQIQQDRPQRWIWPVWMAMLCAPVLALILSSLACTTTIIPPSHPRHPVSVYLLDEGRTSSLALPNNGVATRYAFGEWNWYALGRHGALNGLKAIFWVMPGTLGRQDLEGPVNAGNLDQRVGFKSQVNYEIKVERDAADRLRRQLEARYQEHRQTEVYTDWAKFNFIKDSQSYYLFNNSNRNTARWLRELGCRVRGPAILSRWKVKPPKE